MPNIPIEVQYKSSHISGGFSFSVKSNTIFLSEHFKDIGDERVQAAIQYVAIRARHHYIDEVSKVKARNEKINILYIKRNATEKAKAEACVKFSDVWSVVEKAYKENELGKSSQKIPSTVTKDVKLIILLAEPDILTQLLVHDATVFVTDAECLLQLLKTKAEGGNICA